MLYTRELYSNETLLPPFPYHGKSEAKEKELPLAHAMFFLLPPTFSQVLPTFFHLPTPIHPDAYSKNYHSYLLNPSYGGSTIRYMISFNSHNNPMRYVFLF